MQCHSVIRFPRVSINGGTPLIWMLYFMEIPSMDDDNRGNQKFRGNPQVTLVPRNLHVRVLSIFPRRFSGALPPRCVVSPGRSGGQLAKEPLRHGLARVRSWGVPPIRGMNGFMENTIDGASGAPVMLGDVYKGCKILIYPGWCFEPL